MKKIFLILMLIFTLFTLVGCNKTEKSDLDSDLGNVDISNIQDEHFVNESSSLKYNTKKIETITINGDIYDYQILDNFNVKLIVPHKFELDSTNPYFLHFSSSNDSDEKYKNADIDISFACTPNFLTKPSLLQQFDDNIFVKMNTSYTYNSKKLGKLKISEWPLYNNSEVLYKESDEEVELKNFYLDVSDKKQDGVFYNFIQLEDITDIPGRFIETQEIIGGISSGQLECFDNNNGSYVTAYTTVHIFHGFYEYILTVSSSRNGSDLAKQIAIDIAQNLSFTDLKTSFRTRVTPTKPILLNEIEIYAPNGWDVKVQKDNSLYFLNTDFDSEYFGYGIGFVKANHINSYMMGTEASSLLLSIASAKNESLQSQLQSVYTISSIPDEFEVLRAYHFPSPQVTFSENSFELPVCFTFKSTDLDGSNDLIYFVTSLEQNQPLAEKLLKNVLSFQK